MKRELILSVSIVLATLTQSCYTDVENDLSTPTSEATVSHMKIKFQDKIYETDAVITEDTVFYSNKEYAEIFASQISKLKEKAVLLNKDDEDNYIVEYFSSDQELMKKYDMFDVREDSVYNRISSTPTRAGVIDLWPPTDITSKVLGRATLFDDKGYKDTQLIMYVTDTWATAIPKLSQYGFNDKTSSIIVYNEMNANNYYTLAVPASGSISEELRPGNIGTVKSATYKGSNLRPILKCYHNSNYSGIYIYCIAPVAGSSTPHMDYNLKTIGWNDKISSACWILVDDITEITGVNGNEPKFPAHPDCN